MQQALRLAEAFADQGDVAWFEEPVSSDDLVGLRAVRQRVPAGMDVAAGSTATTRRTSRACSMPARWTSCRPTSRAAPELPSCCGWTASAAPTGVRSRCTAGRGSTPIRLPRCRSFVHLEYFHDHVRIERMLFDGVLEPRDGALWPDCGAPGMGLELKERDARALAA